MTHERCAPFENLVRLHQWLCQRAGSDRIAVYRLNDPMEALGVGKGAIVQTLRRLTLSGAIENISRATVHTMMCRIDRINPVFTPMVGSKKAVRVTTCRTKKQAYRALPPMKGYRDPYECSGPLLGHLKVKADKNDVVSFNLIDIEDFGTEEIIMAALNYLLFKRKIAHMPPPPGDNFKNYTVKIIGGPHA